MPLAGRCPIGGPLPGSQSVDRKPHSTRIDEAVLVLVRFLLLIIVLNFLVVVIFF